MKPRYKFTFREGLPTEQGSFWRLTQVLAALGPAGCDEQRWVDGVLARKKSLGF